MLRNSWVDTLTDFGVFTCVHKYLKTCPSVTCSVRPSQTSPPHWPCPPLPLCCCLSHFSPADKPHISLDALFLVIISLLLVFSSLLHVQHLTSAWHTLDFQQMHVEWMLVCPESVDVSPSLSTDLSHAFALLPSAPWVGALWPPVPKHSDAVVQHSPGELPDRPLVARLAISVLRSDPRLSASHAACAVPPIPHTSHLCGVLLSASLPADGEPVPRTTGLLRADPQLSEGILSILRVWLHHLSRDITNTLSPVCGFFHLFHNVFT